MAAALAATSLGAKAASPYISLQDSYLTGRIDQLVVVAEIPTMRKPYNVKQVRHHLELVKDDYPQLYNEIDRRLSRYEQTVSVTYAEVGLAAADNPENGKVLPNARGERLDSQYRVTGHAQYRPHEHVVLAVGGLALDSAGGQNQSEAESDVIPIGSYAAFGTDSFQVDIGYREHWLSPFNESAMLSSTNARPSFSVGISNPMPFENLWNLQYEVYVSRLEWVEESIYYNGERESGRPALMGTQLSFEPVQGWTIALNRTFQFGGGSRSVTFKDIWDAFWDPVANDNKDKIEGCEGDIKDCEFGNQQASISSRINFGGEVPFAIYMEYAGEDSAGHHNYRLGNLAVSAGLHIPFLPDWLGGENWSLNYEFNEWQNLWYNHQIYGDGYTNDGIVMGHWGGDNRVFNDAIGAQAHTLKLGWQRGVGRRYELTYRTLENQDYSRNEYSTAHELDLRYYGNLFGQNWGYRLYGGTTVFDESFLRGELIWQW
ncbi:capsule assembly Wzi family protein [Ferrimonas marina]|uniref:capsule assembly Wzi family protein n=1 Tax=Ferrimonas marina TaxID=299255 RepID=UPI0013566601|nr:capsule assembly Wzi family protein [Ferrimonas marina]